ncbi:MAG: hypothetical protein NZ853_09185 [Leptospiraceae bacterium]|nr:hypothetical protein [Leptospiraceae bacterium]MDW7975602.1 hypothetical protein [Leptospiraceae bacterium]
MDEVGIIKKSINEQKILKKIIDFYTKNPLPNVLIFSGANRKLKLYIATEIIAKTHLCLNKKGCGECRSCLLMKKIEHPDLILFPEDKIKIGDPEDPEEYSIRWLQKSVLAYKPIISDVRIIIIPSAEMLGNEAEIALLKTLEEPLSESKFILFTPSLHYLSDTIVSRSIVIAIQNFSLDQMKKITEISDYSFLEILGGTLDYSIYELFEFYQKIKPRIQAALEHPLELLNLEEEIEKFMKDNAFLSETQFWEFFSLILMQTLNIKKDPSLLNDIFIFLGGIRMEQPGLSSYLTSRLFFQLYKKIYF